MITIGRGHAQSAAGPDAFFARWVDHATWSQWSPDTAWVRVEGPVREGARGVLKPKSGPRVRFQITTCDPGREYTDTSRLPGARLVFRHTAQPVPGGGTTLDVHVGLEGPLARVWARILGGGFRESAQTDLDRLVRLVEQDVTAR